MTCCTCQSSIAEREELSAARLPDYRLSLSAGMVFTSLYGREEGGVIVFRIVAPVAAGFALLTGSAVAQQTPGGASVDASGPAGVRAESLQPFASIPTVTRQQLVQPDTAGPSPQASQPRTDSPATMANLNADSVRGAVSRSPRFLAELDYRGLTNARGLSLTLAPGAEIDLPRYLRETDLSNRPEIAAVLANPRATGLGALDQRNEVFLLEDRLIVSRQVTVRVPRDACTGSPRSVPGQQFPQGFCLQSVPAGQRTDFSRRPVRGAPSAVNTDEVLGAPPTAADLREEAQALRAELRAMGPRDIYAFDITVAEALRMDDEALMALELNGEEREITHVSVIPLDESLRVPAALDADRMRAPPTRLPDGLMLDRSVGPAVRVIPDLFRAHVLTRADLMPDRRIRAGARLPDAALRQPGSSETRAPGEGVLQAFTPPAQMTLIRPPETTFLNRMTAFEPNQAIVTTSEDFYFLTGFTLSRSIEDRFKHTFNRRKNYFVAFQYSVGFALGLRFPFEVQASSTERFSEVAPGLWRSDDIALTLGARGVSGAERIAGVESVYLASGLDPALRFDDQEFVFRVWAGCQLQVRAPVVKTVRVNCPSVDVPRVGTCPDWACQRFTPPLFGGAQELARFTLPASVTGLRINAWIAEAGLEPGVRLEARDATLGFNLIADGGRFERDGGLACVSPSRGSPTARNRLIAPDRCSLRFFRAGHDSSNRMNFRLASAEGQDASLALVDPVYDFTLALVPFIDLYAAVDIWLARWDFRHTFDVPGLTIQQNFTFPRHDGTRQSIVLGACHPSRPETAACRNASIRIQPVVAGPG